MRYLLLTNMEVTTVTGGPEGNGKHDRISANQFIAIHPYNVATIEPLMGNAGKAIGSKLFVEHRGYVTVREEMTDVMHQIEALDREERAEDNAQ